MTNFLGVVFWLCVFFGLPIFVAAGGGAWMMRNEWLATVLGGLALFIVVGALISVLSGNENGPR